MSKFKCPQCGHGIVFEVVTGVTWKRGISGQDSKGNFIYTGKNEIEVPEDADDDWYRCEKCGAEFSREELEENIN